jgi:plastocyanin
VRRTLPIVALMGVMLAAAALWATSASATLSVILATSDDQFDTSAPDINEGVVAVFDNEDDQSHNVTATGKGPDGKALFRSPTFSGPGELRDVDGTQYLDAGFYDFNCTIHPGTMTGTLEVHDTPSGPVSRPEISLKVKSRKLGKVVDSGRLKVKVRAEGPTAAQDISLKAKKGKKGITKGKKLNLAAGGSKTVKLKLSKRGEEKLADADSAKVKVQGTVAFGFGDKASKKLK